jgi:uncharacterized protein YdhG (YjbR/CyaY superfamily)
MGRFMKQPENVDEYIAATPKDMQVKLKQIRSAIREVAPDAVERISYGMPFYSYKGEEGFKGRLVYFGLLKSSIVLYMRPQDIEPYTNEVAEYKSTKSALHFGLDRPVPVSLVKKLVKGAMRRHETGERGSHTKRRKGEPI